MVTPKYLGGHAGAPPVPPPGGYRGPRRFPDHPLFGDIIAEPERPRRTATIHPAGWIALLSSVLFAALLVGMIVVGEARLTYSVTTLALQIAVAAAIVVALCVRRGRVFGAVALTIALVCNIGTAGAVGALLSPSQERPLAADPPVPGTDPSFSYPGVRGIDPGAVLAAPSLEEIEQQTSELSERIRARLSDEFGFTWVVVDDAQTRPERNGYGGESLLQQFTSATWRTEQPIQDLATKRAVMGAVSDVLVETGVWYDLIALSDPGYVDDRSLESLYGSADPAEQSVWEYATQRIQVGGPGMPSPTLFYATLIDLSRDASGDMRAREEAERADGEPLEGLELMFLAPQVLSASDRAAFEAGT